MISSTYLTHPAYPHSSSCSYEHIKKPFSSTPHKANEINASSTLVFLHSTCAVNGKIKTDRANQQNALHPSLQTEPPPPRRSDHPPNSHPLRHRPCPLQRLRQRSCPRPSRVCCERRSRTWRFQHISALTKPQDTVEKPHKKSKER